MGFLSLLDAIPGVGKHKTVIGAAGAAVGGIMQLFGIEAGAEVQNYSTAYMGLGIAHGRAKARGN